VMITNVDCMLMSWPTAAFCFFVVTVAGGRVTGQLRVDVLMRKVAKKVQTARNETGFLRSCVSRSAPDYLREQGFLSRSFSPYALCCAVTFKRSKLHTIMILQGVCFP